MSRVRLAASQRSAAFQARSRCRRRPFDRNGQRGDVRAFVFFPCPFSGNPAPMRRALRLRQLRQHWPAAIDVALQGEAQCWRAFPLRKRTAAPASLRSAAASNFSRLPAPATRTRRALIAGDVMKEREFEKLAGDFTGLVKRRPAAFPVSGWRDPSTLSTTNSASSSRLATRDQRYFHSRSSYDFQYDRALLARTASRASASSVRARSASRLS